MPYGARSDSAHGDWTTNIRTDRTTGPGADPILRNAALHRGAGATRRTWTAQIATRLYTPIAAPPSLRAPVRARTTVRGPARPVRDHREVPARAPHSASPSAPGCAAPLAVPQARAPRRPVTSPPGPPGRCPPTPIVAGVTQAPDERVEPGRHLASIRDGGLGG